MQWKNYKNWLTWLSQVQNTICANDPYLRCLMVFTISVSQGLGSCNILVSSQIQNVSSDSSQTKWPMSRSQSYASQLKVLCMDICSNNCNLTSLQLNKQNTTFGLQKVSYSSILVFTCIQMYILREETRHVKINVDKWQTDQCHWSWIVLALNLVLAYLAVME